MDFKLGPQKTLTEISTTWEFGIDGDSVQLEKDMISFMQQEKGIGLAANQIGMAKRVFVMGSENIPGFPKPFALFNPRILEKSQDQVIDKEGCLSFPNIWLQIKRSTWIIAQYQDSSGELHEIKIDGYLSKCFQHEYDHLDGICFIDRVSKMKLQLAIKKSRKNK